MKRVYQVVIDTSAGQVQEFEVWLREHMKDMEALSCFQGSELAKVGETRFVARYFYNQPEDIQKYFTKYAQEMRADLPAHFRNSLQFHRYLVEEVLL